MRESRPVPTTETAARPVLITETAVRPIPPELEQYFPQTESMSSKGRMRQRLQEAQEKLNRLISQGCTASRRAEEAERLIHEARAEADRCLREAELATNEVQEIARQLRELDPES